MLSACNILVKYWRRPLTSIWLLYVLVELPLNMVLCEIIYSYFYLQFAMSYLGHSLPGFGLICQMWLQGKLIKLLYKQVLPIPVHKYSSGDWKTTISKENTEPTWCGDTVHILWSVPSVTDPCKKMWQRRSSFPIVFSAIEEDAVLLHNVVKKRQL